MTGWKAGGGELFQDVNVPSKSFGELFESKRHTPSLSAPEVKALLDAKEDVVVLDAKGLPMDQQPPHRRRPGYR